MAARAVAAVFLLSALALSVEDQRQFEDFNMTEVDDDDVEFKDPCKAGKPHLFTSPF